MSETEIGALRTMLLSRPRPAGLAERRQRLDALGQAYALAPDVTVRTVDANGVPAEWTSTPAADVSRVILFLHGGGYVSGSIASHRHLVAEAGRAAGARTLALDYRRAPEHPFPAAIDDAVAGYRFLLSTGVAPSRICIAGDSAGGGITVATLVTIRDAGLALPGCAWCISPWIDLECIGDSMAGKAPVDPMIQRDYLREIAGMYLNGADPRSPLAAPLYAELAGLPPMLVQVGTAETLLDDAVRLAGRAAAANVRVTLEAWPEMIHVWHLFHPQLAEGRRAITAAGNFIRAAMT
ncbi:MAG: alpha/beta hydrolase [Alphaproteobacteria bacterium]|nr:alpha/beta hydrolase [Alphaproteobacteria bacterium]